MPWWVASLISNLAIIATEYLNRVSPSLGAALPRTLPLIAVAQVCLFYAFNGAPHWLMAWLTFSIGNAVMRLGSVALLAEQEVSNWPMAVAGVVIMLGGSFVVKQGLH